MPDSTPCSQPKTARVVIIGLPGCGKSTLAQSLATALHCEHIEIDTLYWGPGWEPRSDEVLRREIASRIAPQSWVADGNYSRLRDLLWQRADTLVWLDYALGLTLWRLLWRCLRRGLSREELWEGCHETLRDQFCSRESLFLDAVRRHRRLRRSVLTALDQPDYAHLRLCRFGQPRQAERWLATLRKERC